MIVFHRSNNNLQAHLNWLVNKTTKSILSLQTRQEFPSNFQHNLNLINELSAYKEIDDIRFNPIYI